MSNSEEANGNKPEDQHTPERQATSHAHDKAEDVRPMVLRDHSETLLGPEIIYQELMTVKEAEYIVGTQDGI